MSITKVRPGDVESFTIVTNPVRHYVSSSTDGVTGSVHLFARRSDREKEMQPLPSFVEATHDDADLDAELRHLQQFGRYARVTGSTSPFILTASARFNNMCDRYLDHVNRQETSARKQKVLDVIRFTPTTSFTSNTLRKLQTKDILQPYYRISYPSAHWAYTNYNCLAFFTSSTVPTSSVLLYPNVAAPDSQVNEGHVSGTYTPSGSFSFDFYINPRYRPDQYDGVFKAGTIFHLSSTYALSLITGSAKDKNGLPLGYRLQLQLSHSADVPPSQVLETITSPTQISGCLAWYDAGNGFTPSQWSDLSGQGHNLIQTSSAFQPALVSSDPEFNNRAVVNTSPSKWMWTDPWSHQQPPPFTWYVVGAAGAAAVYHVALGDAGSFLLLKAENVTGVVSAYNGAQLDSNKIWNSAKRVVASVFNGASSKLYVDDTQVNVTGNTGNAASITRLIMGDYQSLSAPFDGKIAEIIIYAGAHSPGQVYSVMTYLAQKYGSNIGTYPNDLVFRSSDNALAWNRWQHVVVRWGTNRTNAGTGSFNVDGEDRGEFVVTASTVAPATFPAGGPSSPDVLCVGNYFEGLNKGTGSLSYFFAHDPALRDGLEELNGVTDVDEPNRYSFNHPLNADLHDLSIKRYYMTDLDIEQSASRAPTAIDSDRVAFYLPPFFVEDSPFRQFVGTHGGILQTPFEEVDGTTDDPFNVAMSFGVNGHYINIENFLRDFASNVFPRVHHMTGVAIDNTTQAREANAFLYDQSWVRRRNLLLMPCDDGLFIPAFELIASESNRTNAVDDLGIRELSFVHLGKLISTSSLLFGSDFDGDTSFADEAIGYTPEQPGMPPGPASRGYTNMVNDHIASGTFDPGIQNGRPLTIFARTRDPSSNQVTFFDVSNMYYGKRILPKSLVLSDPSLSGSGDALSITLRDDGRGTIYRHDCLSSASTWNAVGTVFYDEGVIALKSPHLYFFGKEGFEIRFRGEQNVHVLRFDVLAAANSLNSSSNPNYKKVPPSSFPNDPEDEFVYITGINFHDDNLNVILKSQLAQPIMKRPGDQLLFKIRTDF